MDDNKILNRTGLIYFWNKIKNYITENTVQKTTTVNGKPLSSNVTLEADDVGAIPYIKGSVGQFLGFTSTNVIGAVDSPSGAAGKRVCKIIVGTSTSGWTKTDCDYLCDGVEDDDELNKAIQALPNNGGEIVILDGTYNITAPILMNKVNIKLSGNGNSTILKRMWNSLVAEGVITIIHGGCFVENICINGNRTNYANVYNYGIYVLSNSNCTITGNTCNYNIYGIYLNNSSNSIIISNTFNNNTNGIYIAGGGNNVIASNICKNNNSYGIYLDASANSVVNGNVCNDNSYGINLKNFNYTVTGNICNNNRTDGIYLVSASNSTITGNTCDGNNTYGIYLNTSNNNTITGNTCNNNAYGINSYLSKNSTITGNIFNNNDIYGIYLKGSSNNIITGNTCIRGEGSSSDYTTSQHTIYLKETSNKYNLIANNNIMGKNYMYDGGTNNQFINNKYN